VAISISCPHCEQNYNLADNQRGKTVRCKGCQQTFLIEAPEEEEAKTAQGPTGLFRPDALKQLLADAPPKKKNSSSPLAPVLFGAVLLAAVLGGFGYGAYWIFTKDRAPDAGPRFVAGPLAPNPQGNPTQPPKETKPAASVDDAVRNLQHSDADVRKQAADWLARADVLPTRKTEVARALARPMAQAGDIDELRALTAALEKWGTLASVNALAGVVAHRDGDVRRRSLAALAAIGPAGEKAVLTVINHPDGGTRDQARKILQGYGTKESAIFDQTVADLGVSDRRLAAVTWLGQAALDEPRRPQVAKALGPLLKDNNKQLREATVRALVVWGTRDNIPGLCDALKDPGLKPTALDILGKLNDDLKDERTAEAVAEAMKDKRRETRTKASEILKAMGAVAEKPVLKVLVESRDAFLRTEACHVLAVVGKKETSLPVLEKVLTEKPAPNLNRALRDAIKAINDRG
jgi:predicted Zn finger-like uncharacterized protein